VRPGPDQRTDSWDHYRDRRQGPSVKSRDGKDLKIELADNVAVAVAKKITFDDIKKGDYVGATTMPGPNGTQVAVEVHYLAPTTPEGQLAWDLQPGSTMTNANVDSMVVGTANHELTLTYKGGTQKIVVVPSTALVRACPVRAPTWSWASVLSARSRPPTAR
jgi:hypothetical protein